MSSGRFFPEGAASLPFNSGEQHPSCLKRDVREKRGALLPCPESPDSPRDSPSSPAQHHSSPRNLLRAWPQLPCRLHWPNLPPHPQFYSLCRILFADAGMAFGLITPFGGCTTHRMWKILGHQTCPHSSLIAHPSATSPSGCVCTCPAPCSSSQLLSGSLPCAFVYSFLSRCCHLHPTPFSTFSLLIIHKDSAPRHLLRAASPCPGIGRFPPGPPLSHC